MQLAKHAELAFAIKRIESGQLEINGVLQTPPFAVTSEALVRLEGLQALSSIDAKLLSPADASRLMQLGNKVFLLATGERTVFPDASVRAAFLSQGIGLEVMDTRAAAYTYNVLIQENRDVCLVVLA
jgi:uncharacterized protein